MGSQQTKTRSKKGVVYSTENNEIVDCLFCRIVRGESQANPLWFRDDKCAIFIPRGPAARLHFLIVPLEHIQNIRALTEEHKSLLEHMKKIALEQLRIHSKHIGSNENPLLPLAHPPSDYAFNRGHLPPLCSPNEYSIDEDSSRDFSFVLCFHRPPYNSIDHLHLHAIQKPYRNLWTHFMFAEKLPWHGDFDDVFIDLMSEKAKL